MYHKTIKLGSLSTSEKEIKDLAKAWIAISLAFAILLSGSFFFSIAFYSSFVLSALTVGIAFLLHELAHKVVAQRYGCFAEFRSFDSMLVLAIIMAFFGFILAAPGAVMINGPVGRSRNGKISAAGPFTNIVLALLFIVIFYLTGPSALVTYGYFINAWLAFFNLLPFGIFDGKKVLAWNRTVYIALVVVALALMLGQGLLFA